MQAQDLVPQVQKLPLAEKLVLLSFLVQTIQRAIASETQVEKPKAISLMGLAKTQKPAPSDAEVQTMLAEHRAERYLYYNSCSLELIDLDLNSGFLCRGSY
ncbi:hypothetical protein IQ260_08920 [Leptolyngbya cf. ectocarpi LEGE 11479]|uniref:Uncharacterized protein n=1 Tax=Leptolyngbya cf. ectocarpi LEGE 11479 TaxID=1828722 RepID=A0A928X4Y6_LEPEC|nr:hypothetical protein [Leptolyngbya ectocarpi]MBE9066773.1 hypothetical protein [Leptolyngbya cf. ectocarpi LEGE 11479]